MYRTLVMAAITGLTVALASAHPHGHDDDRPVYRGPDCNEMAGDFDAGAGRVVNVYVFEERVVFTLKGRHAVVGECTAPKVDGAKSYPRVKVKFDASFGKEVAVASCCTATLRDGKLVFGEVRVAWPLVPQ